MAQWFRPKGRVLTKKPCPTRQARRRMFHRLPGGVGFTSVNRMTNREANELNGYMRKEEVPRWQHVGLAVGGPGSIPGAGCTCTLPFHKTAHGT